MSQINYFYKIQQNIYKQSTIVQTDVVYSTLGKDVTKKSLRGI